MIYSFIKQSLNEEKNIFLKIDNLPRLNRRKRDVFRDVLSGIKRAGRTAVQFDRAVRQAVQNKAIQLLKSGRLGKKGKIAAPVAQKVKKMWDKYDEWKLNLLKD